MADSAIERIERLGRLFTSAEALELCGIPSWTLGRLVERGDVFRVAHGVYLPPSMCPDGRTYAAEASARFPRAVLCLRTAAELHGLTMEVRDSAFLAMPMDFRPKPLMVGNPIDGLKQIRWVRWSSKSREIGVDHLDIHGVRIPVTSPARTVVDYFRYRDSKTSGRRSFFGKDEVYEVMDRYLAGRDVDEDLMGLADIFGVRDMIEPVLDGRRALVTRSF